MVTIHTCQSYQDQSNPKQGRAQYTIGVHAENSAAKPT